MKARYQLAWRKAAELIERSQTSSAPIPLRKIARMLKVKVKYEPFSGELSGMVHANADGSAVIGINSNHSDTRKNFTLAHEIGHLLLHKEEEFHIDAQHPIAFRDESSGLAIDSREIEANQFAAALLMPEQFLRADIRKGNYCSAEEAISSLAEKYEVSQHAMAIRVSALKMLI